MKNRNLPKGLLPFRRPPITRGRARKGMTLLELIIVVAIICAVGYGLRYAFGNRNRVDMQNPSCSIIGTPGR